jgi:hypothetical protein
MTGFSRQSRTNEYSHHHERKIELPERRILDGEPQTVGLPDRLQNIIPKLDCMLRWSDFILGKWILSGAVSHAKPENIPIRTVLIVLRLVWVNY